MREDARTATEQAACQECRRIWSDPVERWRMYVLAAEQVETLLYCPACAAREFGPN